MLAFAAAVFFLIITPGPGVLSTAGVGSGYGARAGLHYVTGLFIGNSAVALAVVSGVAAVFLANPAIRTALLVASGGYLLYLAYKIAFAGSKVAFIEKSEPPGILGGVALQVINPKAYAVHTTLFSGFAFMADQPGTEVILKFAIMSVIWIPIHLAWLWAGISLHRLDLSPQRQRQVNLFMAAAMLAVVVLAAFAPGGLADG